MRNLTFFIAIALLMVINLKAQRNELYVENQIILKFKASAEDQFKDCTIKQKFDQPLLDNLSKQYGLNNIRLTGNKKRKNTILLSFKEKQVLEALMNHYLESGFFEYAEPNFIGVGHGKKGITNVQAAPNDLYFFRQYGLSNNGSFPLSTAVTGADVDMDLAWDIEEGDSSIIVAVLDGGMRSQHPEVAGRLWVNQNETADGTDSDNNGYIDDTLGWSFADNTNFIDDLFGHGTNVAGIIGANGNNSIGYAGIDWHCKLMILKVLDTNNFGLYTWWAEAMYYAVDRGAQVINMSLGGTSFSNVLSDACIYAKDNDVTVVVSTGNDNSNQPFYPSAYPSTIAVGATGADDDRVEPFFWDPLSGSCYGNHIDVVAPGNYIYGLSYSSNSNYGSYWGGTSQAAPLVSGLCALLLAQNPNRSADDLRDILRNTAEDEVGDASEDIPGFDIYFGYGRVNAFNALNSSGVSIAEPISNQQKLTVYPNPGSDYISVSIPAPNTRVQLLDLKGNVIMERKTIIGEKSIRLDVSKFPNAAYLLQLKSSNSQIIGSKKIVVKH